LQTALLIGEKELERSPVRVDPKIVSGAPVFKERAFLSDI